MAILMRWGVTIFKMPPSTAATVNQFPNSKVSDVERDEEREEGQGGHLLFLIRMDQSSSPTRSLYLSICGTLAPFKLFSSHFSLSTPHSGCPPRELNGTEEGCHFKMSPWRNKDPLTPVFFHSTTSSPLSYIHESIWDIFPTFDLQSQAPASCGLETLLNTFSATRAVRNSIIISHTATYTSSAFSQLLETVMVSEKSRA